MSKLLQFKSSLHVEIISSDKALIFDDQGGGQRLEGIPYVLIARLLKKTSCSLDQIVSALEKKLPQQEIYHAVFRLQKKGIIEEADERLPKTLSAFCHLLKLPTESVIDRLEKRTIAVHSVGNISCKEFKRQCRQISIMCHSEGVLNVVFTDNYRREKLQFFHRQSLEQNKPWLLVLPRGPEIWIGPLFIPGKTACFECLLHAIKNNRIEEVLIEERRKNKTLIPHSIADLPTARRIAMNLAMNEVFKWIVQGFNETLEGQILSLNLCSTEMRTHKLIKRTHCHACGVPAKEYPPVPFVLENPPFRSVTPEETFEKYRHHVSPITGIVGFLEVLNGTPSPVIHNYYAGINLADLEFMKRFPMLDGIRTASGGKGKNAIQAKTSCLCEAIERHSGIYQGGETKKKATYEQLGESAIHPHSILLFSEKQYEMRNEWNKNCHRFHFIPAPFNVNQEIDWSPVWSLTEERWKWIPTALCYYSYVDLVGERFCKGDSNGCAAGNTKVEATISAFFELVERDSVAIWWYSLLQRPEVDLASFPDPYIPQLIDHYAQSGRKVWVLDLTMDLEIPTFAAITSTSSGEHILFGFGAHFDPSIALIRALVEMNQSCGMANWRNYGEMLDRNGVEWLRSATTENQLFLLPDSTVPKKKMADYLPHKSSQDPAKDLLSCQSIAEKNGLEMLALDQTRPHIGMPVVRVIVPGLRHFWNRYGEGRLYDVPLKMGLVKEKIEENSLNPVPIFI